MRLLLKLMTSVVLGCAVISAPDARAERQKAYLEKYELGEIRIWMVVPRENKGEYFVYLLDPESYIHHVEVGEYIGNREGRVVSIEPCKVIVAELIPDGSGGLKEVSTSIETNASNCLAD